VYNLRLHARGRRRFGQKEEIMPRKKKEDVLEDTLTPDVADLDEDTIDEGFALASEEEVADMPEEELSGVELQLGVLTARIEELTTIVRKLEKKLEKAGIGDSAAPQKRERRDEDEGFGGRGFGAAREGGFGRREGSGFRPREAGGGFRSREGGGGGFRPREGGESRGGGFGRRDDAPRGGGFGGGNREGGFGRRDDSRGGGFGGNREGGFKPREGGGFGGGNREGGFKPREGGESRGGGFGRGFGRGGDSGGFKPRGEDSRGGGSRDGGGFGGKRRDHGFGGKRRED
jgi:hypothetical protein